MLSFFFSNTYRFFMSFIMKTIIDFLNFIFIFIRNDKYADVMLYTCNSNEDGLNGNGIPAHKLILGTCSHVILFIFYF